MYSMSSHSASRTASAARGGGAERLDRVLRVVEPAALVVAERPQRRRVRCDPSAPCRPRGSRPSTARRRRTRCSGRPRSGSGTRRAREVVMRAVAVVDERARRAPNPWRGGRRTGSTRSSGSNSTLVLIGALVTGRAAGGNSASRAGSSTSVFQSVKSRPLRLPRPLFSPSP